MSAKKLIIHYCAEDFTSEELDLGRQVKDYLSLVLQRVVSDDVEILLSQDLLEESDVWSENGLSAYDAFILMEGHKTVASSLYKGKCQSILSTDKPVFKLCYSPVDLDHDEVGGLENYDLFDAEGKLTFDQSFWGRIMDLCHDVSLSFQVENSSEKGTTVFISDTTLGAQAIKNTIRRELAGHGYNVLPKYTLSYDKKELKNQMNKALDETDLVVHIIGKDYNEDERIVDQLKIVSSHHTTSAKKPERILWVSPEVEELTEEKKVPFERLKRDNSLVAGAELVQVPLEKLKSTLKNRLESSTLQNDVDEIIQQASSKPIIYLIVDIEDREGAKKIASLLEDGGCHVLTTSFDEQKESMLDQHRKYLSICDAILIYHENDNKRWLKMKMLDVLKAPGYGRTKPILAKAMLLLKDVSIQTPEKLKGLEIIKSAEEIQPGVLSVFLKNLN